MGYGKAAGLQVFSFPGRSVLRAFAPLFLLALLLPSPLLGDMPANSEQSSEQKPSEYRLTLNGFIEYEDFLSTRTDQEPADINKKSEFRGNLRLKYGRDRVFMYANANLYIAPVFIDEDLNNEYIYSEGFETGRNGRVSNRAFELEFRELYLNYGFGKYRLRAGNQIYGWGTADVFNPTSYFNPFDLREFLFRDEDELKKGVPSFSTMVFMDIFTVEMVVAPVHTPMTVADVDNFWALKYREGPFPVYVAGPEPLPVALENVSLGARLSKSVSGVDVSFSLFHGPDRDPVFRPRRTVLAPSEPVSVEVVPEHLPSTSVGFDFSTDLGKFVIQGEAAYTPDKPGVVEQPYSINTRFPFEVKRSHYISYSGGFNYFIPLNLLFENHEGDTIFTFEWNQSRYFDNSLMAPLISDILTARLQDSYFDSRLSVTFTLLMDVRNSGYLLWPVVEYDFQNGFKLSLAYGHIEGNDDTVFGYFRDNDIIMLKARYVFQ